MKKSWAVMRRDLIKLSRNPLTIVTSVMLTIIYLIIFGNSFQGVLKNLPIVIVSQDSGPYGLRMMEKMQAVAAGPKTIVVNYAQDAASAIGAVRRGGLQAA